MYRRTARHTLYTRQENELPIPIKYIDIVRETGTDLPVMLEAKINDLWYGCGHKQLSDFWAGKTTFWLLNPKEKKG